MDKDTIEKVDDSLPVMHGYSPEMRYALLQAAATIYAGSWSRDESSCHGTFGISIQGAVFEAKQLLGSIGS